MALAWRGYAPRAVTLLLPSLPFYRYPSESRGPALAQPARIEKSGVPAFAGMTDESDALSSGIVLFPLPLPTRGREILFRPLGRTPSGPT